MSKGFDHQKTAVETGHFPLYRYNPELAAQGKNPLQLDSKPPTQSFAETALKENRFKQLLKLNPNAEAMLQDAEQQFKENFEMLETLAGIKGN
jgi:pyruvate-ferredoxin/flavodoxin oxidoreductase